MHPRHIHYPNLIGLLLSLPLSYVVSQSAFMITKGELHPTYKGFISFTNTVTNVSSNILPEFGVFMCTEPGTYHFTIGAATERNEPFRIVLKRNRDSIATLYGSFNDYQQVSQTAVLQLQSGDYIYPFVEIGEIFESPIDDRAYTIFTGFQIGVGNGQPSTQTSVPTTSGRSLGSTTSFRSPSTAAITPQGNTRVGGSTTGSVSTATTATTTRGTSSGGTTGRTTTTAANTARTTMRAEVTSTRTSGTTGTTSRTTTRPITTTTRPIATISGPTTITTRSTTTIPRSTATTPRSTTTIPRSTATTPRTSATALRTTVRR